MPFEVVQYPNTSPDDSGTEVTVHWSKDSHVQLEVVRHVWGHVCVNGCDGVVTGCDQCPRGTVAEFDKGKEFGAPAIVGEATGSLDVGPAVSSGGLGLHRGTPAPVGVMVELVGTPDPIGPAQIWTQVLSRQEINKLIRVLRRARDQAYGEDA